MINKILLLTYVVVLLISLWILAMYFSLKDYSPSKEYFLSAAIIGILVIILVPVYGSWPLIEWSLLWIIVLIQLIMLGNGSIELSEDVSLPIWIKRSAEAIPLLYLAYTVTILILGIVYYVRT